MKKYSTALAFLACSLLLAACSSSTPISNGGDDDPGKLATVKVLVQLPKAAALGVQPQGVPQSAAKAVVTISRNGALLATKEVKRSDANSQVVEIKLPVNKTYKFSISVNDASLPAKEVAWGSTDFEVMGDVSVTVPLKSILDSAVITTGKSTAKGKEYLLSVLSPNGEMPLSDFEVTYSAIGGQIVTQSKLGVLVDAQSAAVTASVSGLGADHNTKTVVFTYYGSGSSLTLTGRFGFPANYLERLLIKGTTKGGQTITGSIEPDGRYIIVFPDVTSELRPLKDTYSNVSGETGIVKVTPVEALGTQVNDKFTAGVRQTQQYALSVITESGLVVGSVGARDTETNYYTDSRFSRFIYVDRKTMIEGTSKNSGGEDEYYAGTLAPGWNIETVNAYRSGEDYYKSIPLLLDSGTINQAFALNIRKYDSSIKHTADVTGPFEGFDVNHSVEYKARPVQKIELTIPKSLALIGDLTPPSAQIACTGPVVTASSNIYTCAAPSTYLGSAWSGTLNFKTRAVTFDAYQPDPNNFLVRLTGGNFIDTNSKNDSVSLAFTRQAAGANVVVKSDMEAPDITFTPPSLVKIGQPIILSGLVSDNVAPTLVEVYAGVTLLGQATLTGQPVSAWTYQWVPDATGPSRVTVVAYDAAGNSKKAQGELTVTGP